MPTIVMSAGMGLFLLGTQERVRNSRGERAISIRVTEVLLILSGDVIFTDTCISVSYLNMPLLSGEGANSTKQCAFLRPYYQRSTTGEKRVQVTRSLHILIAL